MKILVITAHPDDVDFGAGGTIARWVSEGHEVVYCLVTDGQAGGSDNTISREEMARIRRREQTAAAKVLGVHKLHFLGFPDGAVIADLALRREISAVIRIEKPDRVLTQSSERRYDRIYASHPDHLATGEAALCAVYPDARNEFAFPELLSERGLQHTPFPKPGSWLGRTRRNSSIRRNSSKRRSRPSFAMRASTQIPMDSRNACASGVR